jgi:hypothetical protein
VPLAGSLRAVISRLVVTPIGVMPSNWACAYAVTS